MVMGSSITESWGLSCGLSESHQQVGCCECWISFQKLIPVPAEAEIRSIVADIDTDGRGVIDYKEFEKIMSRDIREYDNEADLKHAWKVSHPPHPHNLQLW
jgi:hypothetical protein